jgi:hypothetical protein
VWVSAAVRSEAGRTQNRAVVIRYRRGTLKAEIPNVSEKSETLGNDPLGIYKPSGTDHYAILLGAFDAMLTISQTDP